MNLPLVTLADVGVSSIKQPVVVERQFVNGNVAEHELAAIAAIVAHFKPMTVFEIGTFDGRTTLNIAVNAPRGAKIYTLDLPANNETRYVTGSRFIGRGARFLDSDKKITQLVGDSAIFDFSNFIGQMDLVFVDGDHSAAYIETDTNTALRLRSSRGVVMWHDYGVWSQEVTEFLNGCLENDPRFRGMFFLEGTSIAVLPP